MLPRTWEFGPPRGTFSIVAQIRSGAVHGRIVSEGQPAPDPRRTALRRLAPLGQADDFASPLFWSCHPNAELIGPTLLLRNSKNQVAVEPAHGPWMVLDDPAYKQFRRPPAVTLSGPWTSVISRWTDGFYHWLYDALPLLAMLPEFPPETRILVPPRLAAFQQDTLRWLGLEGRCRPTAEQHLQIEHFYCSGPPAPTGLYNPYAIDFLRRSFLSRADLAYTPPKRFYIRRVGALRGIVNETEVSEFFLARGWAVIDTAAIPLAQQIRLFSQAEFICANHGAALANLAFCQQGCRVLELFPQTYLNGVYEGVAEAAQLEYQYLIFPGDAQLRARVNLKQLAARLPA